MLGALAEKSELRVGDLILSVNGQHVDAPVSYAGIRESNIAHELSLEVERDASVRTVRIRE